LGKTFETRSFLPSLTTFTHSDLWCLFTAVAAKLFSPNPGLVEKRHSMATQSIQDTPMPPKSDRMISQMPSRECKIARKTRKNDTRSLEVSQREPYEVISNKTFDFAAEWRRHCTRSLQHSSVLEPRKKHVKSIELFNILNKIANYR
jgi:hypothetical protein